MRHRSSFDSAPPPVPALVSWEQTELQNAPKTGDKNNESDNRNNKMEDTMAAKTTEETTTKDAQERSNTFSDQTVDRLFSSLEKLHGIDARTKELEASLRKDAAESAKQVTAVSVAFAERDDKLFYASAVGGAVGAAGAAVGVRYLMPTRDANDYATWMVAGAGGGAVVGQVVARLAYPATPREPKKDAKDAEKK